MYGLGLSFNQPKLCTNATWNSTGSSIIWDPSGQLSFNIFVDYHNRILVVRVQQSQVLIFSPGQLKLECDLNVQTNTQPVLFVSTIGDLYFQGIQEGWIHKLKKDASSSVLVRNF